MLETLRGACEIAGSHQVHLHRQIVPSEGGRQDLQNLPTALWDMPKLPLSPFLFIVLMSVLMQDAKAKLSPQSLQAIQQDRLFEVLYADFAPAH